MSHRLPVVASDANAWGGVLNDFLLVNHNSEGGIARGASFPASPVVGQLFFRTDQTPQTLYRWDGTAWIGIGAGTSHQNLTGIQGGDGVSDFAHVTAVERTQIPSAGQKSALAGTNGTPGSGNPYVTDSDARNANARTPTAHAATHKGGGSDVIDGATTTVAGLMSATDKTKSDKLMVVGENQYVDTIPILNQVVTTNAQVYTVLARAILDLDAHVRTGLTRKVFWQISGGRASGAGTCDFEIFDGTNSVSLGSITGVTAAVTILSKIEITANLPASGTISLQLRARTSASATTAEMRSGHVAVEMRS